MVFEARDENLQEIHIENDKGKKFKVLPYIKENHYGAPRRYVSSSWNDTPPYFFADRNGMASIAVCMD